MRSLYLCLPCSRLCQYILSFNNIQYYLFTVKNNELWTDNFYFVIAADSQFGCILPYEERDPKDWKKEMDKAICAVDKINNLTPKPQFVVVCGDLVNEMPQSKLNQNN